MKTILHKILYRSTFLDRNFNRLFNAKNCVKITFYVHFKLSHNDLITNSIGGDTYRCLGNGWFVLANEKT